jgi:hypothetical protein
MGFFRQGNWPCGVNWHLPLQITFDQRLVGKVQVKNTGYGLAVIVLWLSLSF